jgi:hypothetical protein
MKNAQVFSNVVSLLTAGYFLGAIFAAVLTTASDLASSHDTR